MKKIAMIPRDIAASRFPTKLMQDWQEKNRNSKTYQANSTNNLFWDEVICMYD